MFARAATILAISWISLATFQSTCADELAPLPGNHFDGDDALRDAPYDLPYADSIGTATSGFSAVHSRDHSDTCCSSGACGGCDTCCNACAKAKKAEQLAAAVAGSHKPLFYDNDFGYLNEPKYTDWWPGDYFKQRNLGCLISFDFGGQYRMRHHTEQNHRGLGLTGNDDDFLLYRTRLFANARIGDRLRVFSEFRDALSSFEDFAPRPIEENRADFLNLFVDGKIFDLGDATLSGRVGRQELLYGQQRAISPLDWANTRLTFDGAKLMWSGPEWDIDAFWMRPLPNTTYSFDNPITTLQFYGIYSTYKDLEKDKWELFWLAFDNEITGRRVDSLGGRYLADLGDGWQYEVWGNYQFGIDADDSSHDAAACTCGLGRKIEGSWNPTLWAYFDWASGGERLGAGDGYFQFFPLAHKYLGFMDLFGRANIESPNVQFTCQPTDKLKVLAWYYYFFLEDASDTPYTVAGTPFAPGVAPTSRDLGHELDLLFMYAWNPRVNLGFGYSHFFSGKYYDNPALAFGGDANFYYTQWQYNF